MKSEDGILSQQSFVQCRGQLLAQLIGGSTLYGLNTADSDIDYRGIFFASHPIYTAGFHDIDSIVQTGETDSTYYELTRYLKLLRKSNTQSLEILFAPYSAFTYSHCIYDIIKDNARNLIDTDVFKNSLRGYIYSEMRLATGERSGQLGGKRKAAVAKYGFSPKNFVQILRLCKVGQLFFKHDVYAVRIDEYDKSYHELLMNIKTHPEQYNSDELRKMVDDEYKILNDIMDSSNVKYKFDCNVASHIVHVARETFKV